MADSTQSTITVDPTAIVDNASKPSPHSTTDKILDGANSSSKVSENGEKRNLPSPEATVSSISLLSNSSTTQANSPSHKVKEQVLHSRESSSDMSQIGDSQLSIPKEPVVDPIGATTSTTTTTGEPKKQKSRDHDDEQQLEPPPSSQPSQDSILQETSKGDIPAKPPAQQQLQQQQQQQQQQQPPLQQQKKTRPKGGSKSGKERRPLKLTITNINDDLVDCSLTNGGQTITFKFRLDADSSEAIAQGMVCH